MCKFVTSVIHSTGYSLSQPQTNMPFGEILSQLNQDARAPVRRIEA